MAAPKANQATCTIVTLLSKFLQELDFDELVAEGELLLGVPLVLPEVWSLTTT